MQNNIDDPYAKKISLNLVKIVQTYQNEYLENISKEERSQIEGIITGLSSWTSEMLSSGKLPLIYSIWMKNLYSTMLHNQIQDDYERNSIITSFSSDYFLGNLILKWANGKKLDSKYCKNEKNENLTNKCIFNAFFSLTEALKLIKSKCGRIEVYIFNDNIFRKIGSGLVLMLSIILIFPSAPRSLKCFSIKNPHPQYFSTLMII